MSQKRTDVWDRQKLNTDLNVSEPKSLKLNMKKE